MSLRYGRLFDRTVRAEYERALTLAKQQLGPLPALHSDPHRGDGGKTMLPILGPASSDGDWRDTPAIRPGWPAGPAYAPRPGRLPVCQHL